jgi:polyisoprenyl-teichoic acid--peptidoglycan teichoic acid transferase
VLPLEQDASGVSQVKNGADTQLPTEAQDRETIAIASAIAPIPTGMPNVPPAMPTVAKSNKWRRWLSRGVILGMTGVLSATLGGFIGMVMPLAGAAQQDQNFTLGDLWRKGFSYRITRPVNVLVMGVDLPLDLPEDLKPDDEKQLIFAGRSDAMLLVRIDPDRRNANILSIPRDTQVYLPEQGLSKVNYANVVGGSKLTAQVVSHSLNDVPVDRYIRVSTGAFRELVDLVGGVEVNVPVRMEYEDKTQKLKIDLQPGKQVLNGEQAEQFARFRNDSYGDIGRVQRQQQLIRALREKITSPAMITRLPQAIALFQKYIDTNLSMDELLALVNYGLGLDKDQFRMIMLPGRFSAPEEFEASYWVMDDLAMNQVMHDYFDLSMMETASFQHEQGDLRIAIQNASGNENVGAELLAYLQQQGFNNAYVIDDATEPEEKTQIIAQRGDLQSASTLGNLLELGQVVSASTGDLESDLTIRVGQDWLARKPRI